jgi:hypothetical protein
MAEEVASGSVRSSQGSHRRTPKNVSISSAHRARIACRCPTTAANIATMQPQQQLSQIEKSVTHLLVATKQLLGP